MYKKKKRELKRKLNKIWKVSATGIIILTIPVFIYFYFANFAMNELMIRIWGMYSPIVLFLLGLVVGIKYALRLMLSEDKTGLE